MNILNTVSKHACEIFLKARAPSSSVTPLCGAAKNIIAQ